MSHKFFYYSFVYSDQACSIWTRRANITSLCSIISFDTSLLSDTSCQQLLGPKQEPIFDVTTTTTVFGQ